MSAFVYENYAAKLFDGKMITRTVPGDRFVNSRLPL